ncbi:MAG: serine/threonine-protein kinase [Planctomycetota bacterium]
MPAIETTKVVRKSDGRSAAKSDDEMPAQIGGVRLISLLGEGGMGRVYLGHHAVLDIGVAVKLLRDQGGDPRRFFSEARLAARIEHENVVRVLHAGEELGHRFLVMEYVLGKTLKAHVREVGKLPWRDAAGYILQAARGLAAAHRQGIVHRDIKPTNLLIDKQGRVKVADLGLAHVMSSDAQGTVPGTVLGTPTYMAPEQTRDPHKVTPAADIYALGVCFYYLCSAETPFRGHDSADVMIAHRTAPIPDLRKLVPDVPPAVAGLIVRMMAKNPTDRPADGGAVVEELERILGLATVSTAPIQRPESARSDASRRRVSPWMIGACALTVVGVGLLSWPLFQAGSATKAVGAVSAALPPPPVAAPAGWQTPPRAVFVLADHLPAAAISAIDAACLASHLSLVERERIDALVREQDLTSGGRIDPATAGRLGKLVGGHIALFANLVDDHVQLRCVVVETGELIRSQIVLPAEVGRTTSASIDAAIAVMPTQGITTIDGNRLVVSVGFRHGVRVGDRMELRQVADGPVCATAEVTSVESQRAFLHSESGVRSCEGVLARTRRE